MAAHHGVPYTPFFVVKEFIVSDVNFISLNELKNEVNAQIKIRYNDNGHQGKIFPYENSKIRVVFDKPQLSITPGQSAVFFDNDLVLGGGIIEKSSD